MDFARAAASVAAPGPGGLLRYDRAYIADYPEAPDAGRRYQYALWHPPGYLLALGLWRRLDPGAGDAWLRLFGVACGLGTVLLTAALGRLAGGPLAGALAGLVLALSPFAVQSALLLDAEGTLLPLTAAACALLTLRSAGAAGGGPEGRRGERLPAAGPLAGVAVAFGALLWSKPATGLAIFLVLLTWTAAQRGAATASRLAVAGAAGAAGAVLLWLALALLAGLPPLRPAQDLVAALGQVGGGRPLALVYLVGLIRGAQWLHPLLLCLLVAAPLALRRHEPGAALLAAGGGAALLLLGKLAAGYPKYLAGPLPLLAAVAGAALAGWLAAGGRRPASLVAGTACGAAAGAALAASGPDALVRGAGLEPLTLWLAAGAALLALGWRLGAALPAALSLGLLAGSGLSTAAYQATLPVSTTYFYGAAGQAEAGRWLRRTLPPQTAPAVVADREVAYYAGDVHFVDTERWLDALAGERPGLPPLELGHVRMVVSRDERVRLRMRDAAPLAVFGDYRVWRLPCCPDGSGDAASRPVPPA